MLLVHIIFHQSSLFFPFSFSLFLFLLFLAQSLFLSESHSFFLFFLFPPPASLLFLEEEILIDDLNLILIEIELGQVLQVIR